MNACNALDALANAVRDSWGDDRTLLEAFGWHSPALNRHELSDIPRKLAERMRELSPQMINPDLDSKLALIPNRLSLVQSQTVPQLYSGNSAQSVPAFFGSIDWVKSFVEPLLLPEVDWQDVEDQKLMPRALLRRLKSVDTQINTAEGKAGDLENRIKTIDDAHEAAELLPTELASIQEAKAALDGIKASSNLTVKSIERAAEDVTAQKDAIGAMEAEARLLVEKCGQYSAAMTTKGLGQAFAHRATTAGWSMAAWVVGLLVALIVVGYLAHERVVDLNGLLNDNNITMNRIWANITVAVFSVAAPIWFSWIATKQIGQQFRVAQDYAYKASVAEAYEGYRREAARLDEKFTAQLFGLALTRLGQEPLRFVERENHGSPFQEVFRTIFGKKSASGPINQNEPAEIVGVGN